jgi:TusE/DsrC/DsvC family sulfur relay protein
MGTIAIGDKTYDTDEEGYLVNLGDWTEDVAKTIAKTENIELSDNHWEVVNFLRKYYEEYQIAPAVRVLTKAIGKTLGPEKGNSQYLYELFPYGPAKQACKIAGLPKPTGCV